VIALQSAMRRNDSGGKFMRLRKTIGSLLFLLLVLTFTAGAFAQIGVGISVGFGPPPLPVYDQPLCPGDGYLWTPGYWAWDNDGDDYYWVPGTWVMAPEVGFLWTPPWWGWEGNAFFFHDGFWGPQIGFYGGINYGFGYFGEGYVGGRWQDGRFFYNREVNNVNVTNIRNVYNERVNINNENHVSYNGHGGVEARPTPQQEAAMHERHIGPVGAQSQHIQEARRNPELHAASNHGKPPIAATARPGALREGAVPARAAGGNYNPPPNRGGARGVANGGARSPEPGARPAETGGSRAGGNYVHPHDMPAMERPAAPNTGDPKRDRKYQQQQEKMMSQQNKEREKLQAKQDKEHQQLAKQNANAQRQQQVEQRHQQQTQQLSQRHAQQQQKMQTSMAPSHAPAAPREGGGKPH
jgi:hypothetical protein